METEKKGPAEYGGVVTYTSTGYTETDTIKPGHGYWVRVAQGGELNLSSGAIITPLTIATDPSELTSLTITDANGNQQTLSLTERLSSRSIEWYELPPPPPDGSFDVRYGSGRSLEIVDPYSPGEYPIRITGATYPVTIHWDRRVSGNSLICLGSTEIPMAEHGDVEVATDAISVVVKIVVAEPIPAEYVLEQNFPNPFNPKTTIRYGIPRDGHVRLELFNVLGERAATLIDRDDKAGYHHIEFNANELPSGVYLYRIVAGTFTDQKKFLLLK